MKIYDNKGGVYEIEDKPELLKKYFTVAGTIPTEAGMLEIRQVFLHILTDYFEDKISIDELAYLATQIYFEIKTPKWFDKLENDGTSKSLYSASEIAWQNWKDRDKFIKSHKELKKYLEENKHLLVGSE